VLKLGQQGHSYAAIEAKTGVNRATVRYHLVVAPRKRAH
jgi:hypothetical protein